MEIYTFVQMGGKRESMIVKPILDDDEGLSAKLSQFNAANAQCYLPQDRDRLCARDRMATLVTQQRRAQTQLRLLTRAPKPRAGSR